MYYEIIFCSCFINDIRVLYGLFLVPLFIVLLFNTVVFVMVTVVLIKHTRKKLAKDSNKKKEVTQITIKAIISVFSVMLMFGLSWLFGALSIDKGAIFFQWPFAILNTLQGFFLFLFFCVIGNDAREEWLNLLSCYRRKKKPKHSISTHSRASHAPKSTKYSDLTSRHHSNLTMKKSVGLLSESSLSQLDSSVYDSKAPLDQEMSTFDNCNLKSIAEEPDFVITNNSTVVEETKVDLSSNTPPEKIRRKKTHSQLPPHIQFKLRRPYYHVVIDHEESIPASSSLQFSQDQGLTQTTDIQFSQEHTQEFSQATDMNVFANLTGDSTMGLIDNQYTYV